jgi:hypothetical protein
MFHLSRVMVICAGGALIIATGALVFASLAYFTPATDKIFWGAVAISLASIGVIVLLIIFWPRKEHKSSMKKPES